MISNSCAGQWTVNSISSLRDSMIIYFESITVTNRRTFRTVTLRLTSISVPEGNQQVPLRLQAKPPSCACWSYSISAEHQEWHFPDGTRHVGLVKMGPETKNPTVRFYTPACWPQRQRARRSAHVPLWSSSIEDSSSLPLKHKHPNPLRHLAG